MREKDDSRCGGIFGDGAQYTWERTERKGRFGLKVTMLCADKIRIKFEREELERRGLTYDSLSYRSALTRAVLKEALRRAESEVGFIWQGERLFLEAYPSSGGGCVVLVTRLEEEEEEPAPGENALRLFAFGSTDDLLDALRTGTLRADMGELYCYEGRYLFLTRGEWPGLLEFAAEERPARYLRERLREAGKRVRV